MTFYIKLVIVCVLLLAVAASDVFFYIKGKNNGFNGVLAGVASTSKQEEKRTDAAVVRATVDTRTQEQLKKEANDLRKQLAAAAAAHVQPDCQLDADSLSALQAIAGATK